MRAKANLATVDVVGLNSGYREFVDELRGRYGWWTGGLDAAERANVSSEPWEASASLRSALHPTTGSTSSSTSTRRSS